MQHSSWRKVGFHGGPAACCLLLFACTTNLDAPTGTPAAPGGSGSGSATPVSAGVGGASATGTTSGGSVAGSSGVVTSGGGTTMVVAEPPPFEPPPGTLRRLTRAQFHNAVKDVFGVEADVSDLDPDNWTGDFAVIGAASVVTSERGVEQYHAAIERAVAEVFADDARRSSFIGCEPSAAAADACVRSFIERMGRRAWRRPLDANEVARLVAVADTATSELGSASEGVRWATVALFTSPNFLYRPELGAPTTDGTLRYSNYELASRLAFLIWNSLPHDTLLDAAADGTLDAAEGIRSQAERLLEATAGRAAVGEFAEQYMRLDRVLTQAKDAGLFPEYGPALQEGMVRDMRGTWEALAFDDQASALDLFSLPAAHVYYRHLGSNMNDDFHDTICHGDDGDESNQPRVDTGVIYTMQCLNEFLTTLKDTAHGASNLLDDTLVFVTSDTAWGKIHTNQEWPVLFVGKAGGRLRGDEHHNFQSDNLSKALLTVAQIMGANLTEIGLDAGRVTEPLGGVQA